MASLAHCTRLAAASVVAAVIGSGTANGQKNCVKGIPCGNTCISATKTCRIGSSAGSGGAAGSTIHEVSDPNAEFHRLMADRMNSALPWVWNGRNNLYYANGCRGALAIPASDRRYFRTEAELIRIGFKRAAKDADQCDSAVLLAHRAKVDSFAKESPWVPPDTLFVGSIADRVYFRRTCSAAIDLAENNRRTFITEHEATAAGYRRSRVTGC